MIKVKWIPVTERLPERIEDSHSRNIWVLTENYGTMLGMYHNGKFMANYASELLEVTHWMVLPDGTELDQ